MAIPNWWRPKNPLLHFIKQVSTPGCAITPNSKSLMRKISDYKYFKSRNITIPLGYGQKLKQVNEFQHVTRKPARRIMLICQCQIPDNADKDDITTSICANNTVTLSRGVGGDKSFFVHAPTPSGTYTVVAHICGI